MGIFKPHNVEKAQKIYIHLDCETRGPKAGHHQLVQLSMLAVLDDHNVCPDTNQPFRRGVCPCFVDQRTWSFHADEVRWDENTKTFWSEHPRVYREITENSLPAQEVVQQISNFLNELDQSYTIKGIVMSPSWFDWSHFVHCYNIFSESVVNRFDPGKLNVICLKSYVSIANHLGIPVFYHPNLKHTHNSEKDVQVAAYKFYWLLRSFSLTRKHLEKFSQKRIKRQFATYGDLVKFNLKTKGPESVRWCTPQPRYHKKVNVNFHNGQREFTIRDYIKATSKKSFTWQQQQSFL